MGRVSDDNSPIVQFRQVVAVSRIIADTHLRGQDGSAVDVKGIVRAVVANEDALIAPEGAGFDPYAIVAGRGILSDHAPLIVYCGGVADDEAVAHAARSDVHITGIRPERAGASDHCAVV